MENKYGPDGFPVKEGYGPVVTIPLYIYTKEKGLHSVTSGPEWEHYMAMKRVQTMLDDRAKGCSK